MVTKGSPIVLVTGLNGYIASSTALALLAADFRVRGTVRSKIKHEGPLWTTFHSYIDNGALEIVEVPDSKAAGAWDEVVNGVVGIASIASPGAENLADAEGVIAEAKAGMLSLLGSADAHGGDQLKSVVLLSSLAAMNRADIGPGVKVTDEDFDPNIEQMVLAMGEAAPEMAVYSAIKAAIESTFWEFVNNPERKTAFVGSVVSPGYCIGPAAVLPAEPAALPLSVRSFWHVFAGNAWPADFRVGIFVDVRDVASAVAYCIQNPNNAGGERYLVAKWKGNNQAAADVLREAFPERADIIRKGEPGKGVAPGYDFGDDELGFDGSKFSRAVGRDYITFPQSVIDAAKSFQPWVEEGKDKGMGDEVPVTV